MLGFLRKKRLVVRIVDRTPNESGELNAVRFVKVVSQLAKEGRCISCYPHPGWHGTNDKERFGWTWMPNPAWRARVTELLEKEAVTEVRFLSPDSMDGWSFHAYSTVSVPYVATLSLNETL